MPFHGVFLARIQLSQLLDRGETWPSFRTDRWGNATGRVHRCGPHFLCLPFLGCVKAINLPPRHEYLPWGQRPLGCTQINYRNSMKFTCLVGAVQIYHGNRKNDGQVREINTSQLRRGNNLKKQINNYIGKSMFSFAQNHQSCRLGRPFTSHRCKSCEPCFIIYIYIYIIYIMYI